LLLWLALISISSAKGFKEQPEGVFDCDEDDFTYGNIVSPGHSVFAMGRIFVLGCFYSWDPGSSCDADDH